MTRKPSEILVIGATGSQGGAVVESLSTESSVDVYALTRSPESESAKQLERRGVSVVEGDLEREETLQSIPATIDGVFCVTDYFSAGSRRAEERQGTNAIELAEELGVEQFVYSSAMYADRNTGVAHLESKFAVERRLDRSALSATVLRPAPYFQNFETFQTAIRTGWFPFPVGKDATVPFGDVTDVGVTAAHVFENPDRYAGEAHDVCSSLLCPREVAATLSEVIDVPVTAVRLPDSVVEWSMGSSVADMYRWFDDERVDEPESSLDVTFTSLEQYLRRNEWDSFSPYHALGRLTAPVRTRLFS